MARAVRVFALAFAAVTCGAAAEEQALERDILGFFRPARKAPPAFANVAELHLARRGEYGARASPPFYGMIKTKGKSGATYLLKPPRIDGLHIRFTSKPVRGISYDFAGVLSRPDFSAGGIPVDEVMLRGTMRKIKHRRHIAAAQMEFYFETGG